MNLNVGRDTVIRVDDDSCYPPDEDGRVMAALGGFCYTFGKPTKAKVTHDVVPSASLFGHTRLVKKSKRGTA